MSVQFKGIEKFLEDVDSFGPDLIKTARSAIDRTLNRVKNEGTKIIEKETGLDKKTARKQIKIKRTRKASLSGLIRISDNVMPLSSYNFRTVLASRTKARVFSQDTVGEGYRRSQSSIINPVFNPNFIFYRETSARLPIAKAQGPSVAVQYDVLSERKSFAEDIENFSVDIILKGLIKR